MKIAITGGTGFIGSHLAQRLVSEGHQVVLLARNRRNISIDSAAVTFFPSDLSDPVFLTTAFKDCDAVAHCAGINREIGEQTYRKVHVEATQNVIKAAQKAGVKKIALMSFLRARSS